MGKRSFRASREGVERLTQAFDKYGKTQDCLATEVGCTRQTVNKFLTGKRISKELFISLCNELNLNWQDIAELESEQDKNSRTVPSMNRPLSNNPSTEGTGALTAVVEVNTVQTCITSNTINGLFSITIPGDINSFLKNRKKQNNLLNALRILSSDENATISNIEKGSIKITFNVSSDGIKKLEEEPDKIILVARIICRSEGEGLDLSDTDLSRVDLSGFDLSGINFSCADLTDANLENANLENADLDCADLSGANLRGANLKGTSLNDSIIDDKWLTVWKIVNQSFLGRDLIGADLSSANLSSANLSSANLSSANLSSANLSSANLSSANLSSANL
ncbi:pentapeptide repeat-containing protein, partial [Dolichospermum circinale CS-539/09]